jgi:hypothetical protein
MTLNSDSNRLTRSIRHAAGKLAADHSCLLLKNAKQREKLVFLTNLTRGDRDRMSLTLIS